MKSPPIEQKEQIRKRKRMIPLLFVLFAIAGGNLCNQLVPNQPYQPPRRLSSPR